MRCRFQTRLVTTSDVSATWQIHNSRYGSERNSTRICEWRWTNWRITWVCHVEQCPEWLYTWYFIKYVYHGSPRDLSFDHKAKGTAYVMSFLQQFTSHKQDFLERNATGDETWVQPSTQESKRASMEFKHPGSPWTRKFRVIAKWWLLSDKGSNN